MERDGEMERGGRRGRQHERHRDSDRGSKGFAGVWSVALCGVRVWGGAAWWVEERMREEEEGRRVGRAWRGARRGSLRLAHGGRFAGGVMRRCSAALRCGAWRAARVARCVVRCCGGIRDWPRCACELRFGALPHGGWWAGARCC